jgi:hypothetical protein
MQWRLSSALTLSLAAALLPEAAVACRVSWDMPQVDELKQVPAQGYAFSGFVQELRWVGGREPPGIPHAGFSLKIQVTESFAKPISGTVIVEYGSCDFAPARGQKKINVIAEDAEGGFRAVHHAKYFELVPR